METLPGVYRQPLLLSSAGEKLFQSVTVRMHRKCHSLSCFSNLPPTWSLSVGRDRAHPPPNEQLASVALGLLEIANGEADLLTPSFPNSRPKSVAHCRNAHDGKGCTIRETPLQVLPSRTVATSLCLQRHWPVRPCRTHAPRRRLKQIAHPSPRTGPDTI